MSRFPFSKTWQLWIEVAHQHAAVRDAVISMEKGQPQIRTSVLQSHTHGNYLTLANGVKEIQQGECGLNLNIIVFVNIGRYLESNREYDTDCVMYFVQ